jgi:hypothetical protein
MSSTRPYLRKKAVLIMYKVFLQFPEALRPAFPRLKEKLEDPDQGKNRIFTIMSPTSVFRIIPVICHRHFWTIAIQCGMSKKLIHVQDLIVDGHLIMDDS